MSRSRCGCGKAYTCRTNAANRCTAAGDTSVKPLFMTHAPSDAACAGLSHPQRPATASKSSTSASKQASAASGGSSSVRRWCERTSQRRTVSMAHSHEETAAHT